MCEAIKPTSAGRNGFNKRLITSALCYSNSELDAKPTTDLTVDEADIASFSASETTDRTTKRITAPDKKYFLTWQVVIPWVILPHLGKLPVGEFCPNLANCPSRSFAPTGQITLRGVLPQLGKLPFEEFCHTWANCPLRSFAPPGQIASRGVLPHLGKLPVEESCPTWANYPSRTFAPPGQTAIACGQIARRGVLLHMVVLPHLGQLSYTRTHCSIQRAGNVPR